MSEANQGIEAKIQEIWNRVKTDVGFRRDAADDLPGSLRAAGLPEEAIARFSVSEEERDDEVSGYLPPKWICYSEGDRKECHDANAINY